MRFKYSLYTIVFIITLSAYSSEFRDINTTLYLNGITISALKNPVEVINAPTSIYVIDNNEIQKEIDNSIYDALKDIPNISFSNIYFGYGRVAIRGATGAQIIIRVDGARQNYVSQSGNARSALLIDSDTIGDMEVLLGQASTLYGSGAIGGVISINTINAKDLLQKGKIIGAKTKFTFNDKNRLKAQSYSTYANLIDEKIDIILQHSIKDFGDLRYVDGNKSKRDYKTTSTFFKSNIKLNEENSIMLSFKRYLDELENSRGGYKTRQNQYSLQYRYTPIYNNYIDLFTNFYYLDRRDKFGILNRKTKNINFEHDNFRTMGLDVQNISKFDILGRFTYGLEYFKDEQKSKPKRGIIDFRPDGESENFALFMQNEMFITDNFEAIPSVRYTKYKRSSNSSKKSIYHKNQSNDDLSPSLTLQYFITKNINIFATYGKSFRAPIVDELYVYGAGRLPSFLIGKLSYDDWIVKPNSSLKPETSWGWQGGFGIKLPALFTKHDLLYFKTIFFYQNIEDMIVLSDEELDLKTKTLITSHYNISEANKKGFEIESEYIKNPFSIQLGYAKIKSKDKKTNKPIYSAVNPDTLRAKIYYQIKPWYLGFWLQSYLYRKFQASKNKVPSYAIHNLGLSYTPKGFLNNLELFLGLDNMFNKKYQRYSFTGESFGYGIGRNFKASISYKF